MRISCGERRTLFTGFPEGEPSIWAQKLAIGKTRLNGRPFRWFQHAGFGGDEPASIRWLPPATKRRARRQTTRRQANTLTDRGGPCLPKGFRPCRWPLTSQVRCYASIRGTASPGPVDRGEGRSPSAEYKTVWYEIEVR